MSPRRCLTPPNMPAVVMPRIPMEAAVPAIEAQETKVHWNMYVSVTEGTATVAPPARIK